MPVTVPLNIKKPDTNETRSISLGDPVPQAHHRSDPGARGMGCEMLVPCHTTSRSQSHGRASGVTLFQHDVCAGIRERAEEVCK